MLFFCDIANGDVCKITLFAYSPFDHIKFSYLLQIYCKISFPLDNSTCIDCNGVLHGSDVDDLCGVCEGDNDSCVLPYSNPSTILIQCDGSEDVTLRHQLESVKGAATWIVVAPLPTKGNAIITQTTNSLSPLPVLTYTAHNFDTGMDSVTVQATIISTGAVELLVIPVTIGVCIDCNGVIDGPARLDECGVCEGDNSTCTDCSGTPGGGLQLDYCSGKLLRCVVFLFFYNSDCGQIFFYRSPDIYSSKTRRSCFSENAVLIHHS